MLTRGRRTTPRFTEGFDLIGNLGPGIGGPHDRTQTAGRADRGQPGHPGAHHQHLGRRHLARRGDLTGEEPAEAVRGLDHRAVAGDVGHRRQHIQRLGTRNPRHRVHREHRDRARGQLVDKIGLECGRDQADQRGAVTQRGDLGIVGRVHLQDDVGIPGLIRRTDVGTGLDVRTVGETRRSARAGFDDDVVTELDNLADRLRCGGDTRLTR